MLSQSRTEIHEDIMTITEVNGDNETKSKKATVTLQNTGLFPDSRATCNTIPMHLSNPDTQLEHTEKVLVMYNKTKLCVLSKCKVKVRNPRNNKLSRQEFKVEGQEDRVPLLSKAMKLINVQ